MGSGNAPYPRADILVEKFLLDDSNRYGGRPVLLSAPVVVCDAEALPFPDETFDFVVCSHLIEHVDHPDRVLSELGRVGKAGYLECPNKDYDKLDTPSYHRWFASLDGSTLVLHQKTSALYDAGIKDLVHNTLYRDSGFWSAFWKNLDRFFVMIRWDDRIDFRVEYLELPDGSPGSAERSVFDDPAWVSRHGFSDADESSSTLAGSGIGPQSSGRALSAFWSVLRRISRGAKPEVDWRSIVACPADRGRLVEQQGMLTCLSCGVEYEIVDDVPILVKQ